MSSTVSGIFSSTVPFDRWEFALDAEHPLSVRFAEDDINVASRSPDAVTHDDLRLDLKAKRLSNYRHSLFEVSPGLDLNHLSTSTQDASGSSLRDGMIALLFHLDSPLWCAP